MTMKRILSTGILLFLGLAVTTATAQIPRLISYQGVVPVANYPDGPHSVSIAVYDAPTGGELVYIQQTDVEFSGGLFSTEIGPIPVAVDFSKPYWVGIAIGETPEFEPRIRMTSSPYALRADSAVGAVNALRAIRADVAVRSDRAGRSDTAGVALAISPEATGFVRSVNGRLGDIRIEGAGGTNVQVNGNTITIASQTSGGGPDDAWLLGGNDATAPGIDYLGTSDDKAFEIHVDHDGARLAQTEGRGRVMRFEPTGGSPNILGGYRENSIFPGVGGVTVSGGGSALEPQQVTGNFATIGGGRGNSVADSDGTIGGGRKNTVDGVSGTVAGGQNNRVAGDLGSIGGGIDNQTTGLRSTIGGGSANRTNSTLATVGGGDQNSATGIGGVISGGVKNRVFGNYGTIGGGEGNATAREYSTVAGGRFNNAAVLGSTVGGGVSDTALGSYSTVSGGLANVATDLYATIGGGQANRAEASNATIGGGTLNKITGDFSVIPGGYNLTISGESSFGFLGGLPNETDPMELTEDNVALFANVDLYLGNNDEDAGRLVLYEPVDGSGAFPGLNDHYSSISAGPQDASYDYVLPAGLGSIGDVLAVKSISGKTVTLEWITPQGQPSEVSGDDTEVLRLVEELRERTEQLERTQLLLERTLERLGEIPAAD